MRSRGLNRRNEPFIILLYYIPKKLHKEGIGLVISPQPIRIHIVCCIDLIDDITDIVHEEEVKDLKSVLRFYLKLTHLKNIILNVTITSGISAIFNVCWPLPF